MEDFASEYIRGHQIGQSIVAHKQALAQAAEDHDLTVKAHKLALGHAKLQNDLLHRQAEMAQATTPFTPPDVPGPVQAPMGALPTSMAGGGVADRLRAMLTPAPAQPDFMGPQQQQMAAPTPVSATPAPITPGPSAGTVQGMVPGQNAPVTVHGILGAPDQQITPPTEAQDQAKKLAAMVQQEMMKIQKLGPGDTAVIPGLGSSPIASGGPAKLPEGETPLGPDRVSQLNAITKSLMPESYQLFQLPANATQKDAAMIEKRLEYVQNNTQSQAQREILNQSRDAMRQAAQQARQESQQRADQAQQDREEQNGLKWVQYTDPTTGKQVAGPFSMAKKVGATDASIVPTEEIRNIKDARQVVNMVNKVGKAPEEQGIMQLIDGLNKDGKLGIAVSRLNSFLAGKVGAEPGDDARIMALLNKTELMASLSMKSHFGASGGRSPQMLQHFLDMANAKTMNANTLKAGVASLANYMEDRAHLPPGGLGGGSDPAGLFK